MPERLRSVRPAVRAVLVVAILVLAMLPMRSAQMPVIGAPGSPGGLLVSAAQGETDAGRSPATASPTPTAASDEDASLRAEAQKLGDAADEGSLARTAPDSTEAPTATTAPDPSADPEPPSTPAPSTPSPTAPPVVGIAVHPGDNLQALLNQAAPGSVFSLHAGSYAPFRLPDGLTVQAAGDGEVVVSGATGSWDAGIWVKDASNVTIRGLTIRANTLGIFLRNVRNGLIEGNTISDNAFGLEIHAETTGTVIRNNRIIDNDRFLDPGRKAGGMNLFQTFGGISVSGNTILGNDSVGIEIYGMDDAWIDGNVIAGSNDAIETGAEAGGDCKNNSIVRNTIYHLHAQQEERGIWLRCLSQSLVANNTIVGMDKHGVGITASGDFAGPIDGLRVLNNLIVGGRAFWLNDDLPASVVIDHNGVQPCSGGSCPLSGDVVASIGSSNFPSIAAFQQASPFMDHGIAVDPLFVDRAGGDYRLAAGSPAVDRGTPVTLAFLGPAPDLGRFESR